MKKKETTTTQIRTNIIMIPTPPTLIVVGTVVLASMNEI